MNSTIASLRKVGVPEHVLRFAIRYALSVPVPVAECARRQGVTPSAR